MTDNDEIRTLEAERDKWEKLYKRRDTDYVRMLESKNDKLCELEAELNQCLTAHAELNDKVCALEAEIRLSLLTHTMLNDKVCILTTALAEYKYTPQSYDEMWKRVKEAVNENDELKAEKSELENQRNLLGTELGKLLIRLGIMNPMPATGPELLNCCPKEDEIFPIEAENDELKTELNQCLTAHAMLNDKVCALENTKLDDSNDRCIAEHWNEMND